MWLVHLRWRFFVNACIFLSQRFRSAPSFDIDDIKLADDSILNVTRLSDGDELILKWTFPAFVFVVAAQIDSPRNKSTQICAFPFCHLEFTSIESRLKFVLDSITFHSPTHATVSFLFASLFCSLVISLLFHELENFFWAMISGEAGDESTFVTCEEFTWEFLADDRDLRRQHSNERHTTVEALERNHFGRT